MKHLRVFQDLPASQIVLKKIGSLCSVIKREKFISRRCFASLETKELTSISVLKIRVAKMFNN